MKRLRVLKLGDEVYSQSLQQTAPAYHRTLPQRETQLYGRFKHIDITRLSYQQLLGAETSAGLSSLVFGTLQRGSFDLLLIDNPLSVLAIDSRVTTPIVFDCIDWYEDMVTAEFADASRSAIVRSAFGEAVRRSTAIIAQSPLLLQHAWATRRPAFSRVVPNGYDDALFRPGSPAENTEARSWFEAEHGVSLRGRRLIVYTGKVGEWYRGLINLIEGLGDRDVLAIVGDGPLLPRLPCRENVVLVGAVPLPAVPRFTRAADVLAFPLGVDCSPIAISEYLATGKPIVVPCGRIEWLIRDGIHGAVVEDTLSGWRWGIDRAAALTPTARDANRRLARRLGWEHLTRRFETFLHHVAEARQ